MNNQTVLEMLADLEQFFFSRKSDPKDLGDDNAVILSDTWEHVRAALEAFHKITGLSLE